MSFRELVPMITARSPASLLRVQVLAWALVAGACREGRLQGRCETSDDCAPNNACFSGRCSSNCAADADCGHSFRCLRNNSGAYCVPLLQGCVADCSDGSGCVDGVCRSLCTDVTCSSDQKCVAGHCYGTSPAHEPTLATGGQPASSGGSGTGGQTVSTGGTSGGTAADGGTAHSGGAGAQGNGGSAATGGTPSRGGATGNSGSGGQSSSGASGGISGHDSGGSSGDFTGGQAGATDGGTGPDCTSPTILCGERCVTCTNTCVGGACCGDGVRNGSEACDGDDLGDTSCSSLVALGWVGRPCTDQCQFDSTLCTTPPTEYSQIDDATKWSSFDITTLVAPDPEFLGGAFDGRYLYVAVEGAALSMVVYDSQQEFESPDAWTTLHGSSSIGHGIVYADGYVYAAGSTVATRCNYSGCRQWPGPTGGPFLAAAFDGQYVYFAPASDTTIVSRYDTRKPFDGSTIASTSWTAMDLAFLTPATKGFDAIVVVDKHIYFIGPTTVRYDRSRFFTDSTAWTSLELRHVNEVLGGTDGPKGAAFDGNYIYLAPDEFCRPAGLFNVIARLDPSKDFLSEPAWSSFNIGEVQRDGFANFGSAAGAVFDGRYVYFAGDRSGYCPSFTRDQVMRLDPQAPFEGDALGAGWVRPPPVSEVDINGSSRRGAIFDGRYIYFLPGRTYNTARRTPPRVLRFDAKFPAWLPRSHRASAF